MEEYTKEEFDWNWVRVEEEGGTWVPAGNQDLANEIEERMVDLSVRVIKVATALPDTEPGKHIAKQILRSGTSPAPNYAEARGAESHADFIHKLGIVRKELNETAIWIRVIMKAELLPEQRLNDLLNESTELKKIIATSITTLRRRK